MGMFALTDSQVLHLLWESGREHEGLPGALGWHSGRGDDALDLRHEAHVEHAVGLVKHQVLDILEGDLPLFDKVHQTTGGGDEDVAA